ncbi:MAG: glycosyltransferase [Thermoplasmatales archaeon]|jgi:glycosyltransferase involved in cell wall biosynthesis|nr:glycosyltransferase [Candidatus Thermoplasmatota archaeon]MDA8055897.1 glycosyltransferase [Thermoplasmatales archaeon]
MGESRNIWGISGNELLKKVSSGVTICIPAYNEGENLGRLIKFISSQKSIFDITKEIIVDISGSSDNSRAVLDSLHETYEKIRVVDVGVRDGLINSVQRLILNSKTEIVVRCDADIIIESCTLDKLISEFSQSDVGIVGPRVVSLSDGSSLVERIHEVLYEIHHMVCLSHPKTTNLQVFRNDGNLKLPPGTQVEDIVLQDLVVSKGYRVKYVPDAMIYVLPPSTMKEYVRQRARNIENNLWYKHYTGVPSPTQNPRTIIKSTLRSLKRKSRHFSIYSLIEFLIIELGLTIYVRSRDAIFGSPKYEPWEHVRGTKPRGFYAPKEDK